MKILVIGNGSTGVDYKTKKSYINNHTGWFLNKINEYVTVGFAQFFTKFERNENLQNFDITCSSITNINLSNKKTPLSIFKIIRIVLKYDFVYIFYPSSLGKLIAFISILLSKPFGLYVRGEYFNKNRFDRLVLKNTKFIFTVSPLFVTKLKVFCENVKVIQPMISIKKKDFNLKRKYLKSDLTRILFVGRVEEAKGIYELLTIAKELKKMNFNFILDIVGGGDLYNSILIDLEDKEFSDNIILHGQISNTDDLKSIYNNSDVFVFPSHNEGFPRVLYEAMASGLPIFTTFVGGISGRMKHCDNSIEIPVRNGISAAKIISNYLRDKNMLEAIGKSAQETLRGIIDSSLQSHEKLLIKELFYEK
jgi:glycosyltransferase involved in cell wall biosynthesis